MSTGLASPFRTVGTLVDRLSNGAPPMQCPASSSYWNGWAGERLSSSSSSSLWASRIPITDGYSHSSRNTMKKFWTCPPVCMGRRSSKIATRKGAQDLKKGKLYSKIGKEVVSAVKKGGPNPVSNPALATILEMAKDLDVPKDIVERNIKKASEKGQEDYIEKFYEVYGYGGVGFVVQVLTDNVNRAVAAVRSVVKDNGGKMADSGSVMFRFSRARTVSVKVSDTNKDQLLEIALDAGAEDVIEPSDDEDESEDPSDRYYKIVSSPENYSAILSSLRDEGISFEPDNGFELIPTNPVEVDDEAMELNKELMSELLQFDDVDAVYTDQK